MNALRDRNHDRQERHADYAPEGQHCDHRDNGLARAAQYRRETVRCGEKAEERRADAALRHTESDGLRLLRERADEHRSAEKCYDGDELREDYRAPETEARALAGAVVFARAEVLTDEGRQRDGEAGDGQEREGPLSWRRRRSRDGHLAEGVDICLHDDVRDSDDGVLQAGGQTVVDDEAEHGQLKPIFFMDTRYSSLVVSSLPAQRKKLINCARMVASAAPSTSVLNTPIKTMSRITFSTEDIIR